MIHDQKHLQLIHIVQEGKTQAAPQLLECDPGWFTHVREPSIKQLVFPLTASLWHFKHLTLFG